MPRHSRKLRSAIGAMLSGLLLAVLCIGGSQPAAAGFRMLAARVSPVRMVPGAGRFTWHARVGVGNARVRLSHPRDRVLTRPIVGEPGTFCGGRHYRHGSCPGYGSVNPQLNGSTGEQTFARRRGAGGGGNNGGGGLPPGERRFVPDEVIVELSPGVSPPAIAAFARRHNLTQLESQNFPLIRATLFRLRIGGRRSVATMVSGLANDRIVAAVQPNYLFELDDEVTQKPKAARGDAAQYVLGKLQIEQAQQIATGKDVPVAVIDSEIDAKHPDLDGSIVKSFDALSGEQLPELHGTEMAGAIASHGKLLGIAPGAELLAAHAFDNHSSATSFAIYKSLQWATDNGARIVNMSFAGPEDPDLHRMLTAASAKDIVLIAAAGNAGPDSPPLYPAADPSVIAVTATDADNHLFKMANRGHYIAVAAPGVDILALAPGDAYQITTGTSVAAAHVSGIAALLLQHDPSLKPADIRSILMSTATPLGSDPNSDFGAGLVNAYRAMTSPKSPAVGTDASHEQAKR